MVPRMRRAVFILLFALGVPAARAAAEGASLMQEATALQSLGLRYGESWVPPGESAAWRMDCSNAARHLVRRTRGINLPRTASDQYLYVRQNGRLKRVGGWFGGIPDTGWWAKRLRPGDLLFWEHTYKPKRQPPVTHVMVYLGRGAGGELLMAGAQNSKGVGIYKLRPKVAYGGHGGFLGLFKKKGRLVAYGRLP
jgi:cell wall-associated NlpC family hydrolase